MHLATPAVKARSSLQRLKAKVGGLNKKLPSTPVPAVAHSAAAAEVERIAEGQRAVNARCVAMNCTVSGGGESGRVESSDIYLLEASLCSPTS